MVGSTWGSPRITIGRTLWPLLPTKNALQRKAGDGAGRRGSSKLHSLFWCASNSDAWGLSFHMIAGGPSSASGWGRRFSGLAAGHLSLAVTVMGGRGNVRR